MIVFLTGATGFLGSRLLRRLAAQGHEVHALVRASSSRAGIDLPGVRFHLHDETTERLVEETSRARPDIVVHLAAEYRSDHRPEDVAKLVASNFLLSIQVMEAAARAGARGIILAGSGAEHYGVQKDIPVNLYAALKAATYPVLRYYVDAFDLVGIRLLFHETYGPGDDRGKLLGLLVEAAVQGRALDVSPGEQRLNLVHVDDVTSALEIAMRGIAEERFSSTSCYAVRSPEDVTLRELVSACERAWGHSIQVRWGGKPYRPREVMVPWKGTAVLPGWAPRKPLPEGLREMFDQAGP